MTVSTKPVDRDGASRPGIGAIAALVKKQHALGIVALLVVATLLFASSGSNYDVFVYNTFLLACLGAIALNVLMGTAGQVSVATAGFLALGAYGSVWCERAGIGFPWSILIAACACAVAGAVVALPAMRLRGLGLGLGTIAAFYIILYFANRYQQTAPGAGDAGFFLQSPFPAAAGLVATQLDWVWLLTAVVSVLVLIVSRLSGGRFGRALRVVRDHEAIAPTVGISVFRAKLTVFAFSSFVIGVQGGLAAYLTGQVTTDTYTLLLSMQYLAMVLIGGLDSILGAIVGAAIVTTVPLLVDNVSTSLFGSQSASLNGSYYSEIVYGALVLVFIVAARDGIVGLLRSLAAFTVRRARGPRPEPGSAGVPVTPDAAAPGQAPAPASTP
jgi:branched-chain amino acid transport system permease protein